MKNLLLAVLAAVLLSACAINPQADTDAPVRAYVRALGVVNCSGVVVSPGLVLTASHCVPAPTLTLRPGGNEPQVVANGDDSLDYALLRFPAAEAPCPCATLATREAERGEPVQIVGFPLGLGGQVLTLGESQGIFEGPRMPYGRRLVTTAQVAGGNSGGGVFAYRDGEYQLVGLLVEGAGHLSFAVPLADLRPFLGRYVEL
jgi:S1-C subfamily serine protease